MTGSLAHVLALVLVLVLPAGARSQEVSQDPDSYKGWKISGVQIEGLAQKDLVSEIRGGISLTRKKGFIFKHYLNFYPKDLEQDVQRIRLLLARRGYPYARVEPGFAPESSKEEVKVTLAVEHGPPVMVTDLQINGLSGTNDCRQLQLPCSPGHRFSEPALAKSLDQLVEKLKQQGHARATATSKITSLDSTSVRVTIDATPGPIYRWAGATVTGVAEDQAIVARKKMNVPVGRIFNPDAMARAQDNLRQLGLFSAIRLDLKDAGPQTLDMYADLMSRSPRSIEASAGYWTDEKLKVRARWTHRNLFLYGRGLLLQASYSQYLIDGGLSSWWPTLVGAQTRGEAVLSISREKEEGYRVTTTGLQTSIRYNYSLHANVQLGYALQNVSVTVQPNLQQVFVQEKGLVTYLLLNWNFDSTDDPFDPHHGMLSWAKLEYAPAPILGNTHYWRLESSWSTYRSLGGGLVGAVRLQGGLAAPLGSSSDLLPNRKFYAGGANSMRGFKRRELGPLDAQGVPLGGRVEALGGVELRIPLIGRVGGALFLDTGQVWSRRSQVDLSRMAVAAGPGLRVATPVGPLRIDVGFRLTNLEPSQPKSVLHLGIGNAF
jgi:outer membrane protein insertion porin family